MTFNYSQEISNDYEKLLENEKRYDVIIYAGEDKNLKEIYAHSLVLCTRSQYFCAAFSNEWVKKKNGKFIFKKPNISPELFKIILRFIYCGKIDLTNLQGSEILKLLIAVDELNIQTLITCIQEYLIKNREEFLQQNLIEILQTVYQHEPFTYLLNYCLDNIKIIFDSDKFINLEAPLLEFLSKQDDLNLDEIEILDNLLKWGLARNPLISQDITRLNDEEIITIKKTLQNFIPLIGLYHLSLENLLCPLKKLLPKNLVNNFFKFIGFQHFAIFASWIDKKETLYYDVESMPYNFKLIYRSNIDDDTAEAFHKKCDNKGPTMMILKMRDSEQIIGGYNPLEWDSSGKKSTTDSFIFSFKDRTDLQTAQVGYSNGDPYSIACHPNIFGYNDLYCCDHGWVVSNPFSYPMLDGMPRGRLNIYGYEIFQVLENSKGKKFFDSLKI
ncbi:hypothetical protein C1645_871284 [Glomus cerebriforme]|uniref:BTB/POZ domain-containing protein n=1 Tax=Glomus cerebriforme TaxID=658196 RepID=A0A397TJI7_9GLOM|nr:hypothetical protein C1645_871284 [Glomus cerebriforme]